MNNDDPIGTAETKHRSVIEVVFEESLAKKIDKETFPVFRRKNVKEEKSYRMKWR